jgi:AraC-like DNA-binding protein
LGSAAYGVKEWYKNRLNHRARLQQRVNELLHYREMMVMKQYEGARKTLEAEEQQHSSPDELFLSRAIDCVKQHLDDADYDREQFASDMCVSSSTLYNKLRALTDQNVTSFINRIRLKEACRIMRQRPDIKMSELSMSVGFNTPKYFTKLFKREFGVLPSEFIEQK